MDSDYFEELREMYRTERTRLLAFARGLCGDVETAEDAVQSAFERLLRRSSPPSELRPFVYRSVRNAAIDACRRRNGRSAEELEDSVVADDVDGSLDLITGLQALPARERAAVVLCLVVGYTAVEAGELLGVSANTMSTRRRRGLDRLRRSLGGS